MTDVELVLAISFCLLMQALFNAAEIILVSADRHKLDRKSVV